MSPEVKTAVEHTFFLSAATIFLIAAVIIYGLHCGHDGLMVSSGVAAMAAIAAGVGGFQIGKRISRN